MVRLAASISVGWQLHRLPSRHRSEAGARFTGSTLTGASFHKIDLTGADFTDAVFAVDGGVEPTFTETTCPDFLPSDPTLEGRAACRL